MLGQVYIAGHMRDLIADWYHLIVAKSAIMLVRNRELTTPRFMKTDAGLQLAI